MVEDANLKDLLSTWGLSPKRCDNCKTSPALLFCRPHSAFLCSSCDVEIHSKPLTSGHGRVWLCEVCEQSPADVTCKADSAALCSSCDHRVHSANPLAARHLRLPVTPFFDSPSILNPQSGTDFLNSLLNFESTNSFVDLNQLMPSTDSEVPIQTKSNCVEIDFSNPTAFQFDQGGSQSQVSSSETGVVPDGISNSMSEVSNSANSYGGEMDRKAKVMRYLEKKKNRKFQKTIRYASRKAYAERRPRIKGRFAKRVDIADGNVEQIGFFTDHGVVPLF